MKKVLTIENNPIYGAVGELMSLNRYAYAGANPVNFVDPSGMIGELPPSGCVSQQARPGSCLESCMYSDRMSCVMYQTGLWNEVFNACDRSCRSGMSAATFLPASLKTVYDSCLGAEPPIPPTPPANRANLIVGFNQNRYTQRTLADCNSAFQDGRERMNCWIHVSILNFMTSLPVGTQFTYQTLFEALIEGEYRSAGSDNPQIMAWGNEAVARQFYEACGVDGCQNDEIYSFLDYFQSPLNDTLDDDYRQVLGIRERASNPANTYWVRQRDDLENAVEAVLSPQDEGWLSGRQPGQPYGYATAFGATNVGQYEGCGFAVLVEAGVFFGTTPETDPSIVGGNQCRFQ